MSKKIENQTESEALWLNLFELHYTWYEGEHQSTILATAKEQNEIEKDFKEAVSSVKIDDEKEKDVDCLPTAYDKIVNILTQKGYTVCYFLTDPDYYVEKRGHVKGTQIGKYEIIHIIEKTERKRLR